MAFPSHSQLTQLMAACPSCARGHGGQLMPFPPLPLLEGADLLQRGRSGQGDGHLWNVEGVRCTQPPQPNQQYLGPGSKGGQEFLWEAPKKEERPREYWYLRAWIPSPVIT